jgi:uncharacterized protein YjiS (DUF1127 family)
MHLPHCSNVPIWLTHANVQRYFLLRLEIKDPRYYAIRASTREKETNMLLWGTIVRLYKRWRAYEQTYTELMRLDDRELADINIRRNDIDSIARYTARRL